MQGWVEQGGEALSRRLAAVFGSHETRQMIRANLRPEEEVKKAGALFMTHPVNLYTYLLPISLLLTGNFKPEFASIGIPETLGHLLTTLKIGLYWLFAWRFMGHVTWFALRRGIPFIYVPVGLWITAVLLSQLLSALLIPGHEGTLTRIFRQAAFSIPSACVAVYAAGPMLRAQIGALPELVPMFSFSPKAKVPLLLRLPSDRRGRLRRIQAANQYVEVITDKGVTLLRMSLREAVSQVPAEMGWLCHRSLWILREEVVALSYVRGQPQIRDIDGEVWPVSRTAAPIIREWLDSMQSPAVV